MTTIIKQETSRVGDRIRFTEFSPRTGEWLDEVEDFNRRDLTKIDNYSNDEEDVRIYILKRSGK
jgi:hypothetical protein